MTEIKFDAKLKRRAAEALAAYASQIFDQQSGEWTAVVTLTHAARSETIKTEDDFEYLETQAKVSVADIEIVTGEHERQATQARDAARRQRKTAGTLLDDAFGGGQ
ncbi:hypothetical protein F4561_002616 [Lipingzhangella halophila]|uniref:Uncharacterized protein n=1 Tax=Lipingzhangella halophila TaxID=1783352 RepID=A0A7W7RHZ0_9ACTN|nr:hypothetical protein [Lipingzhangella halophila]MBB4931796.1 hypothetical protein [Lipingzhangella halophila]